MAVSQRHQEEINNVIIYYLLMGFNSKNGLNRMWEKGKMYNSNQVQRSGKMCAKWWYMGTESFQRGNQ